MARPASTLRVDLHALPADDTEELERLTNALRDELLELPVSAVDPAPAPPPPPGTRAGESAAAGVLLVALLGGSGALPMVVEGVRAWLARAGGRSVKLSADGDVLELSGISSQQQERLIEAWLARHDMAGTPDGAEAANEP